MFNPLVDNLSNISDAELDAKISELGRKYWQARNPQLQSQIANILEMYRLEMQARRASEKVKQDQENGENGLDSLINIS